MGWGYPFLILGLVGKLILFDDQAKPHYVRIWGWGREGKGRITDSTAKFGRESLEVLSPHPLGGGVIAPGVKLSFDSLSWTKAFLCFYIKRAQGEKGNVFNVHIKTDGGDADCYFTVDFSKADEEGWVLVKLPLLKFRGFLRLRGMVRSLGFKSAGRPGENCRRFFVDMVYFQLSEEPVVPLEEAPKGEAFVDRRVLVAGKAVRIFIRLEEPCGVFLRVVREDGSVGREIFRGELKEGLHSFEWEGLGDPIREPWGALRWGRVDRKFLPDGNYVLLTTIFKRGKKGLSAKDIEFPLKLKGFGEEREIFIYHKPPGFWPHASRIRLVGKESEKELTLRQELTPSAFGDLFPYVFIRLEGLDITERGVALGRSAPENLALKAKVKTCAEQNPGGTWGGWRGLVDGGNAHWLTPKDYSPEEPIWFELTLPKEALVSKVMVKNTHTVPESNRVRKWRLKFDDGTEEILEVPKDTACHWFRIEPPRKTKRIRAEAVEFWGPRRRDFYGLAEFQVFEFKRYERGFFETDDIMPIGLTKWVRFKGLEVGKGVVKWEYSLDHGESWHPIPKGGDLSRVPRKWGVIRFRCTVEGKAIVKGFELTWRFDPKKPIQKPLNPRWCALKVKGGDFYNRKGERVRLFGWFYTPPFAPKGYTHIDLEEWLLHREREIASFAAYGINCVRLGVSGTLYLPDAESTFPDSPKYAEVMTKSGYSPLYPKLVDETIRLLAKYGIYTIFEFHDNPPWGYWSPIPASGAKKHPDDYPKAFKFARPRIAKLWRWVARHFKGNPFIVGFEVPWNEPVLGHRPWDITSREKGLYYDRLYRELVEECVKAIKSEDPQRICILGPNGWNGIRNDEPWLPPHFWLLPEGVEAFHYHDYPQHIVSREGTMLEWFSYPRATGVPIGRTEGHCRYFFWNKQDTAPGWGKRGVDSMLAQEFAAAHDWTAGWGHGGGERGLFGTDFSRYHAWCRFWREVTPRSRAEVAIVMDSHKRHRSHSQSPHPVVEALLRLHALPFDFLFDNCVIVKREWLKRYKALVLVPEGLPEEVVKTAKESGIPVFEFDSNRKVEEILPRLSGFLKRCEIFVDDRSPPNLLIAYGDRGLVIYERKGKGGTYLVFLRLPLQGKVRLVDECTEEVLYEGSAETLWRKGLKIHLEPFRARLVRIKVKGGSFPCGWQLGYSCKQGFKSFPFNFLTTS